MKKNKEILFITLTFCLLISIGVGILYLIGDIEAKEFRGEIDLICDDLLPDSQYIYYGGANLCCNKLLSPTIDDNGYLNTETWAISCKIIPKEKMIEVING